MRSSGRPKWNDEVGSLIRDEIWFSEKITYGENITNEFSSILMKWTRRDGNLPLCASGRILFSQTDWPGLIVVRIEDARAAISWQSENLK